MGRASDTRRAREAAARRVRKRLGSPGLKRASEATIRKVTRSSGGGGSKRVTEVVTGAPASDPSKLGEVRVTETLPSGQTVQVTAQAGVKESRVERALTQARAEAGREYRQAMVQTEIAQTRASVFEQEVSQQLRAKGYLTKSEIDALGQRYQLTASEKKQLQKEVGGARMVPGQYTPMSPLTSTFYQQIQLRQRPEPGTGTVRALTPGESFALQKSKEASEKLETYAVPKTFAEKLDFPSGFASSEFGRATELARTGFTKVTDPIAKAGAQVLSLAPAGTVAARIAGDIGAVGRGVRRGAEIALIDYPVFAPTYSAAKFGAETVATGGTNIYSMVGGIGARAMTPGQRAELAGELVTVGYIAPKGYARLPKPKLRTGYEPALAGERVGKPYRAEALILRKAGRITRDAPLTIKNIEFSRFESTKGNKPAQQAIRETLIENPQYTLGGSPLLEQTGARLQRRPQDFDIYTDAPLQQTIKSFTDKLDAKKVQYEVRYKTIKGKKKFQGIYIKTGKGRYKEAVTIHSYSEMLAPTQLSVATVKQRLATGITVKSPEGITIVRPELIVRRKLEGGFATQKGEMAQRYSKDIPAGIQATTAVIQRVRERAQTLPAPFKQVEQFRAGYAETYLRGYEKFLGVERVQPVPYRQLPQFTRLERAGMALRTVDFPKFQPGRRGQFYVPQPRELYRGFQAVRPRVSSLPITFERPGARPTRAGGFIEAVQPTSRQIARRPTQYPTTPKRVTRAVPSGYTVRQTPTSYQARAPRSYAPRAPTTYAPRAPSTYAPRPTSYTARPVSYAPRPTSYTPPAPSVYTAPTRYAPSYTVPGLTPTYTPPGRPPREPPKTKFKTEFDLPEFKPDRRYKGPTLRQPRAYIPTLRATVGGIKAPRKGAKTRRLTGLEERPLLF